LGIGDQTLNQSDLLVQSLPNNQFDIKLTTAFEGRLYFALYNALGQQIKFKTLSQSGPDLYQVKLDMSQAASGMYFIKMSGPELETFKSAKLIVR